MKLLQHSKTVMLTWAYQPTVPILIRIVSNFKFKSTKIKTSRVRNFIWEQNIVKSMKIVFLWSSKSSFTELLLDISLYCSVLILEFQLDRRGLQFLKQSNLEASLWYILLCACGVGCSTLNLGKHCYFQVFELLLTTTKKRTNKQNKTKQ